MKKLIGIEVGSYTFNAAAKTIIISGVTLTAYSILLVVHVPTNTILYNFASPTKNGVLTLPGTLVLNADTTSYQNTDALQIFVDIDVPQEVSLLKDDSPSSLLMDVGDIYVRALLRKLMQLKYNSTSELLVAFNGGTIGTVSSVTAMSQGNMAMGDAGKPATYLQFSAITGNMSRRCFQWE